MKRFFLFVLAVIVFMMPVLSSCQHSSQTEQLSTGATTTAQSTTVPIVETKCEHSYSEEITKLPKALDKGEKTFKCDKCEDTYIEEIPETRSFKVLAIGNSFSIDTVWYLGAIAKHMGLENVEVATLYISGCTLDMHWSNISSKANAYEYYKYVDDDWKITKNISVQTALADEEWDVITLQQGSSSSGLSSTYSKLPKILEFLDQNLPTENTQIYWHQTWAYQKDFNNGMFGNYSYDQMKMYNMIKSSIEEKVLTENSIDGVIPAGTAIQNARTSYLGDTLTRDGYHMSNLHGRWITACTWFAYITGASADDIDWTIGANSKRDLQVVIDSVKAALNDPYNVTRITTQKPQ